jgi:hypothetical protein
MQRLACVATLCLAFAPWVLAQAGQGSPQPQTSRTSEDGVVTKAGKTVARGAKKGGEITVDGAKGAGSLVPKGDRHLNRL